MRRHVDSGVDNNDGRDPNIELQSAYSDKRLFENLSPRYRESRMETADDNVTHAPTTDSDETHFLAEEHIRTAPAFATAAINLLIFASLTAAWLQAKGDDCFTQRTTLGGFGAAVACLALAVLAAVKYRLYVAKASGTGNATSPSRSTRRHNPLDMGSGNGNSDVLSSTRSAADSGTPRAARHEVAQLARNARIIEATITAMAISVALLQLLLTSCDDAFVGSVISATAFSGGGAPRAALLLPVTTYIAIAVPLTSALRWQPIACVQASLVVVVFGQLFAERTAMAAGDAAWIGAFVVTQLSAILIGFIATYRRAEEGRDRFQRRAIDAVRAEDIARDRGHLDLLILHSLPGNDLVTQPEAKQLVAAIRGIANAAAPDIPDLRVLPQLPTAAVATIQCSLICLEISANVGENPQSWARQAVCVSQWFDLACAESGLQRVGCFENILVACAGFTPVANPAAAAVSVLCHFRRRVEASSVRHPFATENLRGVLVTGLCGRGFAASAAKLHWTVAGPAVSDAMTLLRVISEQAAGSVVVDRHTVALLPKEYLPLVHSTPGRLAHFVLGVPVLPPSKMPAAWNKRLATPPSEDDIAENSGGVAGLRSPPPARPSTATPTGVATPDPTSEAAAAAAAPSNVLLAAPHGNALLIPKRIHAALYEDVWRFRSAPSPVILRPRWRILSWLWTDFEAPSCKENFLSLLAGQAVRGLAVSCVAALAPAFAVLAIARALESVGGTVAASVSIAAVAVNAGLAVLRPLEPTVAVHGPSLIRFVFAACAPLATVFTVVAPDMRSPPTAPLAVLCAALVQSVWTASYVLDRLRCLLIVLVVGAMYSLFAISLSVDNVVVQVAGPVWVTFLVLFFLHWAALVSAATDAVMRSAQAAGDLAIEVTRESAVRSVLMCLLQAEMLNKLTATRLLEYCLSNAALAPPTMNGTQPVFERLREGAVLRVDLGPPRLHRTPPAPPEDVRGTDAAVQIDPPSRQHPYVVGGQHWEPLWCGQMPSASLDAGNDIMHRSWNAHMILLHAAAEATSISAARQDRKTASGLGCGDPRPLFNMAAALGDAMTIIGRLPWDPSQQQQTSIPHTPADRGGSASPSATRGEALVAELLGAAVVIHAVVADAFRTQQFDRSVSCAVEMGGVVAAVSGRTKMDMMTSGSAVATAAMLVHRADEGTVILGPVAACCCSRDSLLQEMDDWALEVRQGGGGGKPRAWEPLPDLRGAQMVRL